MNPYSRRASMQLLGCLSVPTARRSSSLAVKHDGGIWFHSRSHWESLIIESPTAHTSMFRTDGLPAANFGAARILNGSNIPEGHSTQSGSREIRNTEQADTFHTRHLLLASILAASSGLRVLPACLVPFLADSRLGWPSMNCPIALHLAPWGNLKLSSALDWMEPRDEMDGGMERGFHHRHSVHSSSFPFVLFPTPLTRHEKTERSISLSLSAPTSVVVHLTLDATDRIYTSFQGWLTMFTNLCQGL